MYIVAELGSHSKLCYAQGDVMTFASHELAMDRALAVSANNPGQFQVQSLYSSHYDSMHRLCVQHSDPLKLRAVRLN